MIKTKYIYFYNYDVNESDLCKLESKHLFDQEVKNKLLFSDIIINPSCSAFIKKRLDVLASDSQYSVLINKIKKLNICDEGFKAEYTFLERDSTGYRESLKILKDIGYCIEGNPDYYKPNIIYTICFYNNCWYFGILIKNNFDWHKHKQKPFSYSSSINITIAKSLVNIAAEGNKDTQLLDACCGVGTIMLEACFSGYTIEGCDINWKLCHQARKNLSHFNYKASVLVSDIKDIRKCYDTAIIDLPYNLFSHADENLVFHIIKSTAKVTNRLVVVSTIDISEHINNSGLQVTDFCVVQKGRKTNFSRKIWLCEKK